MGCSYWCSSYGVGHKYLKKIEEMEDVRWPKVVFNDILCTRKKTLMRQNNKWFRKWGICLSMCPTNSKEIKSFVIYKFHKCTWKKELGRKKKYYIEEFNPSHNHQQKAYIGTNISWRAKILIAQLRTNSHKLCYETRRWKAKRSVGGKSMYFFLFEKSENRKAFHCRMWGLQRQQGKVCKYFRN